MTTWREVLDQLAPAMRRMFGPNPDADTEAIAAGFKRGPREAWVVLLDAEGREVTCRTPVVLTASAPGEFTVTRGVPLAGTQRAVATTVRVIDADGRCHDKPIL